VTTTVLFKNSRNCFRSLVSSFFERQRTIENYFTLTAQFGLMDVTTAIGLLIVAILVLIVLYLLVKFGLRFGKYLVVNSILGIIVLVIANFFLANFGLTVPIDLVTILICALAGIPGALLVILLVVIGIIA
jgi:pro-sigmaK processing inhibitor BofA